MEEFMDLVEKMTRIPGVSGCEDGVQDVFYWPWPGKRTPLGSYIYNVQEKGPDSPHLLLTAHMDQIGLIVTGITEGGFLRVAGVGGVDRAVLPAAQVQIHVGKHAFPGVICTIPPHLSKESDALPQIEDLAVDVGFSSKAQAEEVIPVGSRITFLQEPAELLNGRYSAQGLDNRAGCAAVMIAAQALTNFSLNCSISVLLSTLEEVGEQGAATAARLISPTHAIIVDVSFAHTPDARRSQCGEMGKGVMIGISPILDNGMTNAMCRLAKENEIPWQPEVMGGKTGTDSDAIAVANHGVACSLLSIPLRYMHTPVEVIDPEDIHSVVDLIVTYGREKFGGAL